MRIESVAFDMDGLLVNTEELYETVGDRLVQRRGHRLDAALLEQMMGRPSKVALPLMIDWYQLDATVEQLEQETAEIFQQILPERLAPMPGIEALLQHVEDLGLRKCVATSSKRWFAQQVLNQLGWWERFDFVLTAENVQRGKPDPEIYLTAAAQLEVDPEQLLVLEDSQNGCRAGVAAGATVVAVPHRRTAEHDFAGVVFVADSASDQRIRKLLPSD